MAGAAALGSAAAVSLQLPVPPLRWRILAAGLVERSTDAGATWVRVSIDPPVFVIGGASPSPMVCWLIGRDRVVLLSMDGLRFQRVSAPDAAELSSIRATSARQATVTMADGRVFATTDGGVTWRLQGFSPTSF